MSFINIVNVSDTTEKTALTRPAGFTSSADDFTGVARSISKPPQSLRVKQVHFVSRHGARTSLKCSNPEAYGKCRSIETGELIECGPLELTQRGEEDAQVIGEQFRRQYLDKDKLLKDAYDSQQISLLSTPINRTRLTLQALMCGIYPEDQRHWLPLVEVDNTFLMLPMADAFCPRLQELWNEQSELTMARFGQNPQIPELKKEINRFLQRPEDRLVTWIYVWDQMISSQVHGDLQDVPSPRVFKAVEHIAAELLSAFTAGTNEAIKLTCGRFLAHVREQMESLISGNPTTSPVAIYGTHDTFILPLYRMFDGFNGLWPPYTSNIAFELLYDENATPDSSVPYSGWYVRIRMNGQLVQSAIPYDDFWQSLSSMVYQSSDVTSPDYALEKLPKISNPAAWKWTRLRS